MRMGQKWSKKYVPEWWWDLMVMNPIWPNGIIFHQPGFHWNKGISLTKPPFGVKISCEVAIIRPDPMGSRSVKTHLKRIQVTHSSWGPKHFGALILWKITFFDEGSYVGVAGIITGKRWVLVWRFLTLVWWTVQRSNGIIKLYKWDGNIYKINCCNKSIVYEQYTEPKWSDQQQAAL